MAYVCHNQVVRASLLVVLAIAVAAPGCILDRSGTRPADASVGPDATANACPGVDLQSDPRNCGACGRACLRVPTAATSCVAGVCVQECNPGRGDCDGDPATGCEVDLALDAAHCGACEASCAGMATGPNQIAGGCQMGVCQTRCRPGFADCDGDPATGCEADLASERANCGACGRACPLPTNGQPMCVDSECRVQCDDARFLDCNRDPSDGCEVDGLDPFRCGVCPDDTVPTDRICGAADFCRCDPATGCRCVFF